MSGGSKQAAKLRAEIERQCSIGAGTMKADEGYLEATGLWMVNANLDPVALAQSVTPASEQFPHVFRIGAYLFFGLCAFCVSVIAGIVVKKLGVADVVQDAAAYFALVVVFMTLRDMTKQEQPA